jgi:hypothetical protein
MTIKEPLLLTLQLQAELGPSSSRCLRVYLEGRFCELAPHGYSRDYRGDRPQLVIGPLWAANSCSVVVEFLDGNTADPNDAPRADRQDNGPW